MNCEGEIEADTNRLLQPQFSSDTLRAFDGQLHGGLRFGPGKKTDDYVLDWTRASQSVTWPFRLNENALYEVFVNYEAPENTAGGTFEISLGNQTLEGTVQPGVARPVSVGKVALAPGNYRIKVGAKSISGSELFRLRNLELRPASD